MCRFTVTLFYSEIVPPLAGQGSLMQALRQLPGRMTRDKCSGSRDSAGTLPGRISAKCLDRISGRGAAKTSGGECTGFTLFRGTLPGRISAKFRYRTSGRGTAKIPGGECTGFALFRGTPTNSSRSICPTCSLPQSAAYTPRNNAHVSKSRESKKKSSSREASTSKR